MQNNYCIRLQKDEQLALSLELNFKRRQRDEGVPLLRRDSCTSIKLMQYKHKITSLACKQFDNCDTRRRKNNSVTAFKQSFASQSPRCCELYLPECMMKIIIIITYLNIPGRLDLKQMELRKDCVTLCYVDLPVNG